MAEVSDVHVRVNGWCDTCGGLGRTAVEHTDRLNLEHLDLTDSERRFLAMHAQYESNRQDDWRYQHKDPVERARLKARWQQIADTFHTDPWGYGS